VPRAEIEKKGGASLFEHYDSLSQMLRTLHPEFDWRPTRFLVANRLPKNYWSYWDNQLEMMTQIGRKLGVKEVCSHEILLLGLNLLLARGLV